MKEKQGHTMVQVKAPICITILMSDSDASGMTQDELCGLVDEAIDEIAEIVGEWSGDLYARRCMNRTPVIFELSRSWDELPIDELEITLQDDGLFETRGDEE